MQTLSIFFLQAGGNAALMNMLLFMAMFLVFYFFMIRPQQQKHKKQEEFQEALKSGTRIVTTSGILGKIKEINGDIVSLEVGPKSTIRITKAAISRELTDEMYAAKEEKG